MLRQSPIPDELDAPFYAAANEDRLVIQFCTDCDRWQYPPKHNCSACSHSTGLVWRQVSGDGTIYSFAVVHDTQIAVLRDELPFTAAVIELNECPGIVMVSHIHASSPGDVEIGLAVRVTFVPTVATDQKVPEWVLQ
ncbi:hypothetical protein GPOL_c25430 [Gordonia polyisoprenivorans VH2]|uniref:DUF35 domain-containing protein n=2 Tax=Gordonia polyisoprenivorans TaxID=84595 RepID=H6N4J0_GORPV|nr:hypothetical protein GPOL_c25430 [Gordonia polyisoprenivorans VH2]